MLFSGFVVMTAMAGMFLMGSKTFASFGVGTVLVVAVALLGSLTVLPAVLSKLGDRVERGRIPLHARVGARDGESRLWRAVIGLVMRHPLILGGAAAAALVALAIPALTLHTVNSGMQGLPRHLPVMQVYTRIQRVFTGGAGPAVVVVSARDVTGPRASRRSSAPHSRAGACASRSPSRPARRAGRPA